MSHPRHQPDPHEAHRHEPDPHQPHRHEADPHDRGRQHANRIDLAGPQRRRFLVIAAVCAATGVASAVACLLIWSHDSHRLDVRLGALVIVFLAVVPYYVRTAHGWVAFEPGGLRTSRLLRGRFIPWTDINDMRQRTYRGRAGHVTVVTVHTTGGKTYRLPAPRSTVSGDAGFDRSVGNLRAEIERRVGPLTSRRAGRPAG